MPKLPSSNPLLDVREQVVNCRRCARLVRYRERVARDKRKEFLQWDYWGRPVPGFGDPDATLLIVGLAPAAHGGNRTGRVFTGDRSGDFLYKCLYKAGFANQPTSTSVNDGLKLNGAYVTAAVKCAPPDNTPSSQETLNCSKYLVAEIDSLPQLNAILCLGQFAYDAVLRTIINKYNPSKPPPAFKHGQLVTFGDGIPRVVCAYHPSPRNTQTGKLTERMFLTVLRKVKAL